MAGFTEFSDDVAEHYKSLESTEWVKIDKEYEDYLSKCYKKFKDEMSAGEKLDFWKDVLSYGFYRSYSDNNYEFDLEEFGVNIDEEIEALSEAGKEELERFIKEEFSPQWNNAIDEILKEFEYWGEKLKIWLDEM